MTGAASAVLVFGFDASLQVGDLAVRWQTLGIAVAVLAGLAWCALIAGRTPAGATWNEPSALRFTAIAPPSSTTEVPSPSVAAFPPNRTSKPFPFLRTEMAPPAQFHR